MIVIHKLLPDLTSNLWFINRNEEQGGLKNSARTKGIKEKEDKKLNKSLNLGSPDRTVIGSNANGTSVKIIEENKMPDWKNGNDRNFSRIPPYKNTNKNTSFRVNRSF